MIEELTRDGRLFYLEINFATFGILFSASTKKISF